MCIQNTLQQHILTITDEGKAVADFFYATMQGKTRNAQVHHRIDAAKQLSKYGISITSSPSTEEAQNMAETQENTSSSIEEAHDEDKNPPHPVHPVHPVSSVTPSDIANYEMAKLIRHETNDGYLIADFLWRIMRDDETLHGDRPENRITPANRMAAAKELLDRGFGSFGHSRRNRISNGSDHYDLDDSGLARYIRDRTEEGLDAARFLLDVASGQEKNFFMCHRIAATRELIRRGWDTNVDAITSEDVAAYYRQQDEREQTEYDKALQEWREEEAAKRQVEFVEQERQRELDAEIEPGALAHLSESEILRYESMSPELQQAFIQEQKALRQAHASNPQIRSP